VDKLQAEARLMLENQKASLVLIKDGEKPHVDFRPGLLPLWQAFREEKWDGGILADKVIGRGAAFLAVGMGLCSVYSHIMSEGAEEIFLAHNLEYQCEKKVARIKDRSGKGLCPMEALLDGVTEFEDAINRLNSFFMEKTSG